MTQLLEKAFQKIAHELSEAEQNILAQIMLEADSHTLIVEAAWAFRKGEHYNKETQQAMQDITDGRNLTQYENSDDLFENLGI